MSGDLPKLLLLVRGQIRLDVLGITPHQVNAGVNQDLQVDDPGPATLSFALRCPSQFADSARSRYHVACIGMVNQINGYGFNAIRSDWLRGLGLELRQLQDRDLGRIVHYHDYTAMRYRGFRDVDCEIDGFLAVLLVTDWAQNPANTGEFSRGGAEDKEFSSPRPLRLCERSFAFPAPSGELRPLANGRMGRNERSYFAEAKHYRPRTDPGSHG